MPGVTGEYVSTPDSAGNSITGDIDVRVKLSDGVNFSPASTSLLIGQWATPHKNWAVYFTASNAFFGYSVDGSATIGRSFAPIPSGTQYLRATHDVDNGAGGNDVKLWTSLTGLDGSWVEHGHSVAAGTVTRHDSANPLTVGDQSGGGLPFACEVEWAEVRDGIDGTIVSRFNAADASADAATWVDPVTGQTNTINRSTAAGYKVVVVPAGESLMQVDGVNDGPVVVGDMSVMDFVPGTGLTLVADVRMHNTTLSAGRILTNATYPDDGAALQRVGTGPRLQGRLDDGTSIANIGDNADNITYGVRTVAVAAFGSSDHEFYTDGVSRETATTAVLAEPSATLPTFGRRVDGGGPWAGDVYAIAIVKDRIDTCAVKSLTAEMAAS
jgi:hypothetical protein